MNKKKKKNISSESLYFWTIFANFSVNSAFVSLRELIPTEPKTRKLSKIETLRLAKSYIEHLVAMLMTGKGQNMKLENGFNKI